MTWFQFEMAIMFRLFRGSRAQRFEQSTNDLISIKSRIDIFTFLTIYQGTHRCCRVLRVCISWLCCQWCCVSVGLMCWCVALSPTSSTSIRSAWDCACRTCHSGTAWSLIPLYMRRSRAWIRVTRRWRTALERVRNGTRLVFMFFI